MNCIVVQYCREWKQPCILFFKHLCLLFSKQLPCAVLCTLVCMSCVLPRAASRKTKESEIPLHTESAPGNMQEVAESTQEAGQKLRSTADSDNTATGDRAHRNKTGGKVPDTEAEMEDNGKERVTSRNEEPSAQVHSAGQTQAEKNRDNAAHDSETSASIGKGKKIKETNAPSDSVFSSIHRKGLIVADGNKWYYENYDRRGRPSFAVLYEAGKAVEKTEWFYKEKAHYPFQKKILKAAESEIFTYDESGRLICTERYEKKRLILREENAYTDIGKLKERTITKGKNSERSVWEFAGDKAVSETKYRNGTKIAFIELHSTPHIVHLYADGKEVYVGEEQ